MPLLPEADRGVGSGDGTLHAGSSHRNSAGHATTRTKATAYHRQCNDPQFDLRSELYRITGVDLTDIPGVSAATAQVILTEIGTDVSRFRHASAFASGLGLCPEKPVSGGKVLSSKTRKVKHRAATALRMGANFLCRAKGYFGEFFRRMRAN